MIALHISPFEKCTHSFFLSCVFIPPSIRHNSLLQCVCEEHNVCVIDLGWKLINFQQAWHAYTHTHIRTYAYGRTQNVYDKMSKDHVQSSHRRARLLSYSLIWSAQISSVDEMKILRKTRVQLSWLEWKSVECEAVEQCGTVCMTLFFFFCCCCCRFGFVVLLIGNDKIGAIFVVFQAITGLYWLKVNTHTLSVWSIKDVIQFSTKTYMAAHSFLRRMMYGNGKTLTNNIMTHHHHHHHHRH